MTGVVEQGGHETGQGQGRAGIRQWQDRGRAGHDRGGGARAGQKQDRVGQFFFWSTRLARRLLPRKGKLQAGYFSSYLRYVKVQESKAKQEVTLNGSLCVRVQKQGKARTGDTFIHIHTNVKNIKEIKYKLKCIVSPKVV